MASQDDTPQQKPTTGESADTGRDRAETGAGDGLSDASETIVSGDHAAGTEAKGPRPAATTAEGTGSTPADAGASAGSAGGEDDLGHEDWDAAFADAAGTPADATVPRGNAAASGDSAPADAAVVPGGHPSLAQRSSLPMRRASTMPDVSGYGELSEAEQKAAGDIDADLPSRGTAPETSAPAGNASATAGKASAAAGAGAVSGSGAVAGSGAAGSGSAQHVPETARSTAQSAPAAASGVDSTDAKDADEKAADVKAAAAPSGRESAEARAADDEISEEEARRRAEERERAGSAKPVLARILQVMIAVFFPVMLLAAAIRAVATPVFLWIEYHRPGFPQDSYGFSTDDRMTYGSYAVDYLLNFSGARYLGDLVTAGGEPLYLESEVSHMADVKTVLTIAFVSALAMALLSIIACVYLAKRSPGGIRRALFAGAVLTLVLVGALIVTAVLGWESFFTQVHTIFFANGNWTFRMDDTLIRLFPAQFWMDAGIAIAGLVLLTCIVVLICSWPTKARRERARIKQEAARRRYLDSLEAV